MRKSYRILLFFIVLFFLSLIAAGVGINIRYPVRHRSTILQHAGDLPPSFIFSVIKTESGFRPDARSHKGAAGLMQLTGPTAREMAEKMGLADYDPDMVWDPEINIAIGSYYLNYLSAHYQGDLTLTLCSYNAGMGNVRRWLNDPQYSDNGKTLHTIPFPETDQYVQRVYFNQKVYDVLLSMRK